MFMSIAVGAVLDLTRTLHAQNEHFEPTNFNTEHVYIYSRWSIAAFSG